MKMFLENISLVMGLGGIGFLVYSFILRMSNPYEADMWAMMGGFEISVAAGCTGYLMRMENVNA